VTKNHGMHFDILAHFELADPQGPLH
jgi:hypothetical protein